MIILPADESGAVKAGECIASGGIVAFPTETVYGLGGNGLDAFVVARIFEVKGRPADNPTILHVESVEILSSVAVDIPDVVFQLADRFWPGPLTVIVKRGPRVPSEVSAGLDTVAVRVPGHMLALKMIEVAGCPVAAPSANLSGRPSPTSARHVIAELGDRIDAVLDGGDCDRGIESTVLDLSAGRAKILRPGFVTDRELSEVLGYVPPFGDGAGSPGLRHAHYRPRCRVRLFSGFPPVPTRRDGVVTLSSEPHQAIYSRRMRSLEEYAREYYRILREADEAGVECLYLERPILHGLGMALLDRMRRSAGEV